MTVKIAVFVLAALIHSAMPADANQAAVIPAYSLVSAFHSSMKEYRNFINDENRAAARKLLNSKKSFFRREISGSRWSWSTKASPR